MEKELDVRIRKATARDVPALESLIRSSARELSKGYYTEAQTEGAITDIFGVDTQLIRDGTYVVAEVGGQTVGCGGWSKRRTLFGGDQREIGREDNLLDPDEEAAKIRAFFVHPEWARRGIGRCILAHCENEAEQAGFSRLELGSTLPGEPFYRKEGYDEVERQLVALRNGAVAEIVVMQKDLS